MEEYIYLNKCLQLVEERTGLGKSKYWLNKDFQQLSEQIYAQTRILISPQTLKRLFGKVATTRNYSPQTETKKALAIFLGYADWEEFKRKPAGVPFPVEAPGSVATETAEHPVSPAPVQSPVLADAARERDSPRVDNLAAPVTNPAAFTARKRRRHWPWLVAGVLMLGGLLVFAGVRGWHSPPAPRPATGAVRFTADKIKGVSPFSTTFRYDLSRLPADSVFLDTDNGTPINWLPKDRTSFTYSFLYPGFYKVKLVSGGKTLSTSGIHAVSNGWFGAICLKAQQEFFQIPNPSFQTHEGSLHVSAAHLESLNFNRDQQYWVEYRNIGDFEISADSFTLETRVMNNSPNGGALCKDVVLHLLGENNTARIPLLNPGCITWAYVQFSEVAQEGKFNDLSALGQDVSDWKTVRVVVNRGICRLFLEGKLIYQLAYRQPLGQLKGIRLAFNGNGYVDYVKLLNASQQEKYRDDFND